MKKDKPRNLALDTLISLEKKGEYTGNFLDEIFKSNKDLDKRDRAFVSTLVQGVIRWKLRLDWITDRYASIPMKKIDPLILNILRLALYQILFLDRVPESAAVDRAVAQAKEYKGHRHIVSFVNGILRNICRNKGSIIFPDKKKSPEKYLTYFYSFPLWLSERCLNEFGIDFTEQLFEAQNTLPDLNIRSNSLKLSREELIAILADEGINGESTVYPPECILLKDFTGRIEKPASFKKGFFQVQDRAAQIMSWLIMPAPGDSILDVCAGLGGKSTHLIELMNCKGSVTALDKDINRLKTLRENARRLGIENIKTITVDVTKPFSDKLSSKFDKVLVDAPCSGLGTISRHPDIKWNRSEPDIKRLGRMQKSILANSAAVLKRGGTLLYVVCTYTREENKTVVDNFLRSTEDMTLLDLRDHIPEWGMDLIDNDGFFRSYPNVHKMDGFFAALFKKN